MLPFLASVLPAVLGAGANALGSMLTGQEEAANAEAAIRARNKVTRRELKRQDKFTRNAAGVFTNALDLFDADRVDTRMQRADNQATGAVVGNLPTDFGSIGTALAPQALQKDAATFTGEGAAEGQKFGDTLGQLLSHDQWLFNNDRALAKTGHKLNRISDSARGSAGVSAIEQAVAGGNAQTPPSIWGPLLQAGGTIGSYLVGQGGIKLPTNPLLKTG